MSARKSGRKLRAVPNGKVDERVIEAMRVCFERNGKNLTEMFAVKKRFGICTLAFTCLEPIVEGTGGGKYGCKDHLAAQYAGVKLETHRRMESAYGKIRAAENAKKKEEAEAEAVREARNEKIAKSVRGKKVA